jgi:hypothetical protein
MGHDRRSQNANSDVKHTGIGDNLSPWDEPQQHAAPFGSGKDEFCNKAKRDDGNERTADPTTSARSVALMAISARIHKPNPTGLLK